MVQKEILAGYQPVFFGVESRMPLLALYCSAVIATVGVLFFLLFNASFSDLVKCGDDDNHNQFGGCGDY